MAGGKKEWKKLFFLCIPFLFFLILGSGCEKKAATGKQETPVLSMETLQLDQELDRIMAIYCISGKVYITGKQGEEAYLGSISLDGKEQEWETLPELNGEVSALASDGKGNFRMLLTMYQMDQGYYNILPVQYKKGSGEITEEQKVKLELDYLPAISMDMENIAIAAGQQKLIIYGNNCSDDGKELTSALSDTLFVKDGIVYNAIAGAGEIERFDIRSGEKVSSFQTGLSDSAIRRIFISEDNGDKEYLYYIETADGIYGCRREQKAEQLFSWVEEGIIETYLSCVGGADGVFFAAEEQGRLYRIAADVEAAEKEQGEDIIFATLKRDDNMQRWINEFNESQREYHVKIVSYEQQENPEESLKLDIISENAPDIIESHGSYGLLDLLEQKGVLLNLYPYLDADRELSRDSLMEKPLKLLETDGKLYRMAPSFTVSCMAGEKDFFHGKQTWNWEEYLTSLRSLPRKNITLDLTGIPIWQGSFLNSWSQYFDLSTGKTAFDGKLKNLLESLEEIPGTYLEPGMEIEAPYACIDLGMGLHAGCFYQMADLSKKFGKNGFSFIGYPTDSGTGVGMSYQKQYAVLSTSDQKDGAWEFLRSLWGRDYQDWEQSGGYPMNKESFEREKECAMYTGKKEYINENGDYIYSTTEKGYPLTKKQFHMIEEMIDLADTRVFGWTHPVYQIIFEEAQNMKKEKDYTVEKMLDMIQNRVKLFLNEQK